MRNNTKSSSILYTSIAAISLFSFACSPSSSVDSSKTKGKAVKSPIERLARSAVKQQVKQSEEAATASAEVLNEQPESAAKTVDQNEELQAMADLLSGAASIKAEKAAQKRIKQRHAAPTKQSGPSLNSQNRKSLRKASAPVASRPIDTRASEELESHLSDASFSRIVRDWRGVKTCVKSLTSRGMGGSGALRINFRINFDGSVASSKISDASNTIAQRVGNCVARQARKIRFPAYAGTEVVSKEAKFVF
ncbi:MAG: hypothetical protein VYC39_09785 [Myxococcota bacterium]|nr:hypothetical protein [Myxococcota bacterium]